MRKTIIECVAEYAKNTPEAIAVIKEGQETSYRELFSMVCGYAAYLKENGVKKGDRVVVRAEQGLGYVIRYLSIHSLGAVVVSMEKRSADEVLSETASGLKARVILADSGSKNTDFLWIEPGDAVEISQKQVFDEEALRKGYPSLQDSADILFTTGTTGTSKGVELSHNALAATAENLIYGCEYKKDTVLLVPGPLNHANAIRKLFTTLVNGSAIYLLDGMTNVKAFYTALQYEKGSIACCLPPSAVRTIFRLTQDRLGAYADWIDFIESATAPLPEPDKLRLCKLLPRTRLYNNYGSSEAASVCMYDYNRYPGKEACIGKAMPNAGIVIVDDDHNEIVSSKEHTGLIACKGDVNMKGYVNEPELTKEVLKDGVLYTSDIGYKDEEGFIYIIGRRGDVINVGGLKVAPAEVEAAALAYDGVEDCICIGVEDSITGSALKLLLVMKEGKRLEPRALQKFMAERLEAHKVPRFYELTDAVKRTYNGKLDRKAYIK